MRRRMKEKLTFLAFVLAYGVIFAAMTARTWLRPRWLGLTIFAVGCTFFLLLGLWYVLGVLIYWRRPVASRPWILGGPPNPSPPEDPATRDR